MNELGPLPVQPRPAPNGCPVALYLPEFMPKQPSSISVPRKGETLSRQRSRNEAVASLPPYLGARLLRRGRGFYLKLERNEQTIAHSPPVALEVVCPSGASN